MLMYELLKDYIPNKICIKEKENGEFLIVSSPTLDIYYFNNTAKDFYQAIDGEKTVDGIVNYLLDEYDVSKDVLSSDFINVLREFQWKQLVVLERRERHEKI